MATGKATKTATEATQTAQISPETAEGKEVTTEATETAKNVDNEAETGSFIYLGPSILKEGLKSNTVYTGTRAQIKEMLKNTLEKYPQVDKLIYPTERLGEIKEKVKKNGTLLNKYYTDILSLIKK